MEPPEPTSDGLNEDLAGGPGATAGRALPAGSWLGGFELKGLIAEGSVTIVYAAADPAVEAEVAIAEYMPAGLAQRDGQAHVTPRAAADTDAFARGLEAFIVETRTLARCDHPSLVRILGQWESNSTAYRVMPRYAATPLVEVRQGMSEPPDEASVRALLDALLGALEAFHATGGCHGKVTSSNILLLDDRRPVLLGPDAAGRAIAGDAPDPPTFSAEPCFAPIEQIVEPDVELPLSADLYALAGIARYWMSGQLPPPANSAPGTERPESVASTAQRLSATWPQLHYSAALVDALDNALSIYPAQRPQSAAQMRERLGTAPPAPLPIDASRREVAAAPSDIDAAPGEIDAAQSETDAAPSRHAVPGEAMTAAPAFDSRRPPPNRRRVAMWTCAGLIVLALLGIAHQYRDGRDIGRVLDSLGIRHGNEASDGAAAPVAGTAAPMPPQKAAEPEPAKPVATSPTPPAAPVPSTEPAPPAGTPSDADAGPAAPVAAVPVAPARARAPPRAQAAPRHAEPPSASPREVCGGRTEFSLYRCMQKQCSQRQWASHAQCERLRNTDRVD